MSDEILLNIMFTGTYLENDRSKNIGHEIINLFKDDNGNNYIYALSYGTIDKKHNDKIKTILLVKRCNSTIIEILAKATGLEQVAYTNKTRTLDAQKIINEQLEYINKNNITYGGVRLDKIFEENNDKMQVAFITFKAQNVFKVKKPIYITTDVNNKDYIFMPDKPHFKSQDPKLYFSVTKYPISYGILKKIIDNENYWEKDNSTQTIKITPDTKNEQNFIKIINKEHDELIYSNLLAHFFKAKQKTFCKFAKDILKIDNFDEKFQILRESEQNIDLLIKTDKNIVIIENKIKSGINGICDRHNLGSGLVQTQLKKYYEYAENKYSAKNRNYYIFAPNYNHINLKEYTCGEFYKLIEYSQIYEFFKANSSEYDDVAYFDEFLLALKSHTKSVDSHHEEEMHHRFVTMINKIKSCDIAPLS